MKNIAKFLLPFLFFSLSCNFYYTERAKKAYNAGKKLKAIKYLKHIKKKPDVYHRIGIIYYEISNYDSSVVYLLKAYNLKTDNADYIKDLASVYKTLKDTTKALMYFKKAYSLSPDSIVLNNISYLYFNTSEYDSALVYANEALKRYPEDESFLMLKALILQYKKDYTQALGIYERLREKGMNDPVLYHNMGVIYLDMKKYKEAYEIFTKLIEASHDNLSYLYRAKASLGLKKFKDALADVDHILQEDHNNFKAVHLKYKVLLNMHDRALLEKFKKEYKSFFELKAPTSR